MRDEPRSQRDALPIGPSAVVVVLLLVLVWLIAIPKTTPFWSFLIEAGTAIGTVAAAMFAAFSASATRASVEELRLGRATESRPALSIEPVADYFGMLWASPFGTSPHRYWFGSEPRDKAGDIALRLINFGGGAALDLKLVYEFEDAIQPGAIEAREGEFYVPGGPDRPEGYVLTLMFDPKEEVLLFGKSGIFRVRTSSEAFAPHCGPDRERQINIPHGLLNYALLRAWRAKDGWAADKPPPQYEAVLRVTIDFDTSLEKGRQEVFRLGVSALWQAHVGPTLKRFPRVDAQRKWAWNSNPCRAHSTWEQRYHRCCSNPRRPQAHRPSYRDHRLALQATVAGWLQGVR